MRIAYPLRKRVLAGEVLLAGILLAAHYLPLVAEQATGASTPSQCNVPPADPISYVAVPGHPFSMVSTKDGCWLFVSLSSDNPRQANGIALFAHSGGRFILQKVFLVESGPAKMVITHDEKLLIGADDDFVVFMDVTRMVQGGGDPIVGYLRDGDSPGSIYVNVTADDKFLFVSDEQAQGITVINLEKARAEGYKESAIIGRIPTGRAPIALSFSPDQRWLYTTSQAMPEEGWPTECKPEGGPPAAKPNHPKGAILLVDVERAKTDPAHAVVAKVPAGCNPVRLALSPSGDRAYVTVRNNNALFAFDTGKLKDDPAHALIGSVPVGTSPVGLALVNEGKLAIVSNSSRFSQNRNARQTLTVLDTAKVGEGLSAVVGTLPAGAFPREFEASSDGRLLYLSNFLSNEIEVIDTRRLPIVLTGK